MPLPIAAAEQESLNLAIKTYQHYVKYVSKHNLQGILNCLSCESAAAFRAMLADEEFKPIFNEWISAYIPGTQVIHGNLKGKTIFLLAKSGASHFEVQLREKAGGWSVHSETLLTRSGLRKI